MTNLTSLHRLIFFGLRKQLLSARAHTSALARVVVISLLIGLGACELDNSTKPQTKQNQQSNAEETVLLGDDFYGEETSETPVKGPTEEKKATTNNNAAKASKENSQSSTKHNPIANYEFSPAESQSGETTENQPFCLNQAESSTSKTSALQVCKAISNRLASVELADCTAAKLKATSCNSVKGYPLMISEFAPIASRKPQGRILVIGGIHGDELTSVSIVFRWIEKLNKYHSGLFHWHVIPLANPDSVLRPDAKRTNHNGVDINRNFPSNDWTANALKYWHEKQGKNPRRYPGQKAASEPETQWLIDEINQFKPDAIISVHAPYGIVDFDSYLIKSAPKSLGKLHLNLLGTYPGSLGNYAGINRNIPVITVELPHAWEMPSHQESTKIWEDIVKWLKKNINTETQDD